MKRRMLILALVLTIGLVAGAGYSGLRSVRGNGAPEAEAPSTVEVTRGDVQTTVTAPGHLVYPRETWLAFGVGGKLADLSVQPGQEVAAGELLAQLDRAPLLAGVTAAQAHLDAAQAGKDHLLAGPSPADWAAAQLALAGAEARLSQLNAGPSAADISAAEAEVATAQGDLEYLLSLPDPNASLMAQAQVDKATAALQQAQAAYDLVKDRPDVGLLPQSLALQQATIDHQAATAGLDAARQKAAPAALQAAQARLAAAQARLDQMKEGPSPEEVALAELQVQEARARLDHLSAGPSAAEVRQAETVVELAVLALSGAQADLEAATLVAPFAGTVLEVAAGPGEMIAAAAGLILLADNAQMEVEATVIEEDLPPVRAGQQVELFFDAMPEALVQGSVVRIVPQRLPGDRPLYPVYIAMGALPEGLAAGMTADASIVIDSRQAVLRLPRVMVRTRSDGTASVQVWTGREVQERQVQVGLRGDDYVEILSGVAEGEEVVAQ